MTTPTPATTSRGFLARAVVRIREEPAAVTLFVDAAIALGLAFGLDLSAGQVTAIGAFVAAALWLFLRARVVPKVKVEAVLAELEQLRAERAGVEGAAARHPANPKRVP